MSGSRSETLGLFREKNVVVKTKLFDLPEVYFIKESFTCQEKNIQTLYSNLEVLLN